MEPEEVGEEGVQWVVGTVTRKKIGDEENTRIGRKKL